MKTLRLALAVLTVLFLCIGYALSQIAFFNGTYLAYAARVDQPRVALLATVILAVAVVLAILPDRSEVNDEQ